MFEIDKEKFGAFAAQLRKEKGLMQKELAEKLYVSDKENHQFDCFHISSSSRLTMAPALNSSSSNSFAFS